MRALVLAAGYGTRLGGLTKNTPKPMLDLDGRPLLEWIISNLASQGIIDIAVNLHFGAEVIKKYFEDGASFGVRLHYSYEAELLGTAGAAYKLRDYLSEENSFMIHYGDVITDQDFRGMWQQHEERNALATLLLHERERSNSIVTIDDYRCIVDFLERPTEQQRAGKNSKYVNSGICILSREVLESIPANKPSDLPRDVFPEIIKKGRAFGYPLCGYRCAVDSPERLGEVRQSAKNGQLKNNNLSTITPE